jgi:hypothetical protein
MRWVICFLAFLHITPAFAHDIYGGVRDQNGVGQLCCGGDPVTGDCEGLADSQIQFLKSGGVVMFSKRYGRPVIVSKDKIEWNTIPGDKGVHAGHFCGVPREKIGRTEAPTDDQPDPYMWTYCSFVSPGGV